MERSEHYETIKKNTLDSLVSDAKWHLVKDLDNDPDIDFMMSCYSPTSSLYGVTDYKDHTRDTLEQSKAEILERLKNHYPAQTGNYYNIDGQPFDSIVIKNHTGGYSAYCLWSNGSKSFFEHIYS